MFTEILKIKPQLDNKDLREMERTLQGRFTKLAKGFGKGLLNAVKGAGVAGIVLGLIDKVLNPLQDVQEAIDRSLKSSDDISTNARQFETTTGKLFKMVQLAKATGLDQDNLFTLINKYQNAVAEAKADPNADSAVRNFTGEKDQVEGFFNFIQSLQKMEKSQQLLVQQQVFGEKQVLKMADFLQSDFPKLFKETGLDKTSSQKFGEAIDGMAGLNDLSDILSVRRGNTDVLDKGARINEGMIRERDKAEQLAQKQENQRISAYTNLSQISSSVTQIMTLIDKGVSAFGSFVPMITQAVDKITGYLDKFSKSSIFKGIFKWGKDD